MIAGAEAQAGDLQAAARKFGLELRVQHASTDAEFETAFANMVQLRAAALFIGVDAFFISRRDQIAALAVRHVLPAIYYLREFAVAGLRDEPASPALMINVRGYGPPLARSVETTVGLCEATNLRL